MSYKMDVKYEQDDQHFQTNLKPVMSFPLP